MMSYKFKLSESEKIAIAQNLIDILEKDSEITEETKSFIANWILTVSDEKTKDFFDVWDIVLKNYLPTTRPVLFRSCARIGKDGKIASFTGQLECAKAFSNGRGSLIICETKETLMGEEEIYLPGQYRHTFYPLGSVLKKAQDCGGWGFYENLLSRYMGEDEYIMRIDLRAMHCFKWLNN